MADTKTLTLAEFLLARIAEDDAAIEGTKVNSYPLDSDSFSMRFNSWESDHTEEDREYLDRFDPVRQRAECEAKRRIVEYAEMQSTPDDEWILILAQPYASHPDFRAEWSV